MSIHGDYAARIIHDQRSHDLRAEARNDGLVRQALAAAKAATGRKAAARARSRARTA
ncbi:hypothetical protein [Jiangella aurantiaca]|uniref:hypothetical protein n=1 Tax=Jiangella aurantiaca TaxID=2530373 RepID=UPI0013A5EEFD|nr:hypothetical protein [Jiangella aurantiaca]